jgi:predicted AlkP superfamily phosphohydrolase/phosphomutase
MLIGRSSFRLICLAIVLSSLTLACSSDVEYPGKVIVVGIDAADWGVMKHLLDEGKLPNFARLILHGATGKLETLLPLRKSPILWTSIATGVMPERHGIGGFVQPAATGDSVPYTGNVRRVKAIWNILSEKAMKVAIVGWMVTWPAEEVNGYMVTDYLQYEVEGGIKLEAQTFPEDLFEEIDRFRLRRRDANDDAIAHLFPVEYSDEELGDEAWKRDYVRMLYATDETFRRVALYLNDKGVDLVAVYFNGIDSVCHNFWGYRGKTDHPFGRVIDDYYVWMDRVLGQFIDEVDDETLLVVCSDHGFYGFRYTRDGALRLGVNMHGRYGVIALMGNCVRRGAPIIDADILDVTPTILYALGLPVARDMEGRVLTDGFDIEFLKSHPVTFVPTYETESREAGTPLRSPVDDKIKQRLKALGYIQ